jgi:hypothetical protein
MKNNLKSFKFFLAIGAMELILAITAGAQTITNGNFEIPVQLLQPPNQILSVGATIPGWTVVGSGNVGVQQVNQGIPLWPGNPSQFLDLTGETGGAGIKSDAFATLVGQNYKVTFDAFNGSLEYNLGHPIGTPYFGPALSLQASGSSLQLYSSPTDLPAGVPGLSLSYSFTANATSTILTFMDASGYDSNAGWIDNVAIQVVPEPTSVGCFMLGLSVLVYFQRLKKKPM